MMGGLFLLVLLKLWISSGLAGFSLSTSGPQRVLVGKDDTLDIKCSLRSDSDKDRILDFAWQRTTIKNKVSQDLFHFDILTQQATQLASGIEILHRFSQVGREMEDKLTISKFTSCDEGEYVCEAQGFPDYKKSQFFQTIDTPFKEENVIVQPTESIDFRVVKTAELTCTVQNVEPVPIIEWIRKKDGEPSVTVRNTSSYEVLHPVVQKMNNKTCSYTATLRLTLTAGGLTGEHTYHCQISGNPLADSVSVKPHVSAIYSPSISEAAIGCLGQPMCIGLISGAFALGIFVAVIVCVVLCRRRKSRRRRSSPTNDIGTKKGDEEMRIMNRSDSPPPPEYEEDGHRLDCTVNTTLHDEYGGCHSDEEEEDVKPKQKHLNVLL